ncbi:chemotaxis protein CheW [Porphyrobacter sp. ULC335]|uniref:chemotaxis protein CheW n=1 Tax=Porphyrobacter sp. ULC335 TaxID=2854260 RepID=UPI00221E3F86|nr:chemotaxis protein CheW [Porphyrobacter sp. ULC335]UYV15660.1 chemotaxis protein CheW [Porphyrobacter sp. ULC335]
MTGDLLVIAQIAGRRCALSALDVKSVIEIGTITPIPRAPVWIAGITALRSQALTVIDCRRAIGLTGGQAEGDWATDHRAAVVAEGGYSYALLVDGIEDITTAVGEAGQVPGGFGPEWSRIATGMIETMAGPALLIDLAALLTGPEAVRHEIEVAA